MKRTLAALALVVVAGCSTVAERRAQVIKQGRALLRHPEPGDQQWESRRVVFLANADAELPEEAPK